MKTPTHTALEILHTFPRDGLGVSAEIFAKRYWPDRKVGRYLKLAASGFLSHLYRKGLIEHARYGFQLSAAGVQWLEERAARP